jgi:hypothetical protein
MDRDRLRKFTVAAGLFTGALGLYYFVKRFTKATIKLPSPEVSYYTTEGSEIEDDLPIAWEVERQILEKYTIIRIVGSLKANFARCVRRLRRTFRESRRDYLASDIDKYTKFVSEFYAQYSSIDSLAKENLVQVC